MKGKNVLPHVKQAVAAYASPSCSSALISEKTRKFRRFAWIFRTY